MKIEVEKVKSEFTSKISNLNNKLDSIEFGNSNLLDKSLHTEMRKMRVEINESNKKATESVRLGNWNEQSDCRENMLRFINYQKTATRIYRTAYFER